MNCKDSSFAKVLPAQSAIPLIRDAVEILCRSVSAACFDPVLG